MHKAKVQTIIKNYNDTGNYDSKPRSGRPKKLDNRIRRKIVRKVAENPKQSAIKLAAELQSLENLTVHSENIRRVLKKSGISSHIARRKPLVSLTNTRKRLEYAKKYEKVHIDDPTFWERVIFTDECKFNVFGRDGRTKVWRKPNTALNIKNICPTVKMPPCIPILLWYGDAWRRMELGSCTLLTG